MKRNLVYAGLFVASLLVSMEIVLLLVPHNTEQGTPRTESKPGGKPTMDSLVARVDSSASKHDSVAMTLKDTLKYVERPESKELRDSLELLVAQLSAERRKVGSLSVHAASDSTRPDTASAKERKVVAKLLESMDAQGAAKILHELDDKEVKDILFAVKKRQAGKILGSLDPARAARIIK